MGRPLAVFRFVSGRRVGWLCLASLLLIAALSIGVRARTYLVTRKIDAVLSGLQRVRLDATTEEQLLKTVPFLVPQPRRESTVIYRVAIANDENGVWWPPLPGWFYSLGPLPHSLIPENNRWQVMTVPVKAVYLLGWRHLSFDASVTVVDGIVSSIFYELEPDVFFGWPKSYFVVARSAHGFWHGRGRPVPVRSADEQRPEYRFGAIAGQFSWLLGTDNSIGVAYASDAPTAWVAHVFELDLSCFWAIRGCASVRQVTPFLWEERQATEAATASRLTSPEPCPDRILAERVRRLPDLNIALLEVVRSRFEDVNTEGHQSSEIVADYGLMEVIRGRADGPFTGIRLRRVIPSPLNAKEMIANRLGRSLPRPGDRMLYFSGAEFDSCRMVPATPSAESSVRTAVPVSKRSEDDIAFFMFGRR